MPTEMLAKNEPNASPSVSPDDELRDWARKHVQRVHRLKLHVAAYVFGMIVLTPAWAAIGTRIGKKRGYTYSSLILAAGALLIVSAQAVPAAAVYLAVGLVGVGYAGCQVFPMAMLPDAAAVDARRTGSNRAGVYTGVWTAAG